MSGGASGYRAWLLQRVSALYMALFLVYFLFGIVAGGAADYEQWRSWIGSLPMALATALFFLALLGHAWVGIRDVFIDYVKPVALRFALLVGLALFLIAMGLWVVKALLMGNS